MLCNWRDFFLCMNLSFYFQVYGRTQKKSCDFIWLKFSDVLFMHYILCWFLISTAFLAIQISFDEQIQCDFLQTFFVWCWIRWKWKWSQVQAEFTLIFKVWELLDIAPNKLITTVLFIKVLLSATDVSTGWFSIFPSLQSLLSKCTQKSN